ncbi:hypothetical protein GCM10022273_36950 [Cellulomonas soli]
MQRTPSPEPAVEGAPIIDVDESGLNEMGTQLFSVNHALKESILFPGERILAPSYLFPHGLRMKCTNGAFARQFGRRQATVRDGEALTPKVRKHAIAKFVRRAH